MKKLVIFDSNYIAQRGFHATSLITSYEKLTNIIYGYLNTVLMVQGQVNPAAMIAVWDNPTAASWRTDLYPGYKATRKFKVRDPEFSMQVQDLKQALPDIGIPCIASEVTEADDVIGYLAYKYAKAGYEVVIFSNDGDFFQLMDNDSIKVLNPSRGFIRPEEHEDYGVPASRIVEFKALVGDSSDEYAGVPRFGKVTAKKFLDVNKSIESVFDGTADFSTISPGMAARLMSCRDEMFLCKKLAAIDTEKGTVPDIVWPKKDMSSFRDFCIEMEFMSFVEKRWKEFERLPEGGLDV